MATTNQTTQATFPRITRVPGVVGGEPVIQGTRISVSTIAAYHRDGYDIQALYEAFPHLSPGTVEEALAYYEVNREEIDRYAAENEQVYDD